MLSRDINNIIKKYLDYSINNLLSIVKKNNKQSKWKFINPDITMEDIMTLCAKLGSSGFYLHKNENSENLIERLISKISQSTIKEFIHIGNGGGNRFYFAIDRYGSQCHILALNIIRY